jgi:cardiolipin synthase
MSFFANADGHAPVLPGSEGMNIPNVLTLFRILLVPAFLIAVIYGRLTSALVIFVVAGVTDVLDGFFAKRLKQKTLLGSYLDPLADKLLMTVSFVCLAAMGYLPAWLAVLVVAKDLFVSIGVAILFVTGQRIVIAPTLWGKQTTFLQIITVGLVLVFSVAGKGMDFLWILFVLTGVVTIFSGLHYIVSGVRSLSPDSGSKGGSFKNV